MEDILIHKEEEDRKQGILVSFAVHALLLLLMLMPCLSYFDPPQDIEGILVVFGQTDAGDPELDVKSEAPAAASAAKPTPVKKKPVEKPEPPTKAKFVKAVPVEEPVKVESELVQEVAEVKAVKTKVIEPAKEEIKEEVEESPAPEPKKVEVTESKPSKSQEQIDAENNAKKYQEAKSQFGSMFGKSDNASAGKEAGQQGDPLGKPDAKALEGISKGSGRVGGGLSNRGVLYEPNFSDNSQKSGIVVVKICVDDTGNVLSAKFTQKGSTTTDSYLVGLAEREVAKYKFTPSETLEQCGTITIDFKIQ